MTPRVTSKSFGDLAEFRNGVNFAASDRGAGDLAVIGVGDFQAHDRLTDFSGLERIARPKSLDDDALLRDGDLVFVRSNGNKELIGRCMVLGGIGQPVSHSGFTIRARLTSNEVTPEWIAQYFATGLAKRAIMRRGGGTNISNLSQQILQDLPIPVPEPTYGEKVLRVAEGYSKTLKSLDDALRAKRTFKRGLMQQLLTGRKRFPEFRDRPWVRRPFSDYFVEKSVANADRTVDLVYSCTKTAGIVPQAERFGKRLASKDLARYKVIEPGDLVYDPMLLWDGSIGFVPSNGRGVVSPAYETFTVKDAANREYFWPLLKSYNLVHRYKQISQGTNTRRRKAHPSDFLKTVVPMPPTKEEQDRIADVLCTAQREIAQLAQLHELIDAQRRALLSRLLSGSLAVP